MNIPMLPKPKILIFFITYKCDSKCIMCSIWNKQSGYNELSISDIENLFGDPLITRNIERINLTGGEPTIYPYLLDAVKIFYRKCSRLKSIDMPTNGLNTSNVLDKIETILAILIHTDIALSVTVSLDGIGETAEKVRNVVGAFKKVNETITGLIELKDLYKSKLSININTTITKANYDNLEQLREYALEKKIGINFTPAAISEIGVTSVQKEKGFLIGPDETPAVIQFFEKLTKNSEIAESYGDFVINGLKGQKRKTGCIFRQKKAALIEPTGDIYLCGNFKQFWIGNIKNNTFSEIWENIKLFGTAEFQKKCDYCASNCYK